MANAQELKTTPLYAWHKAHGARLVPFAGYAMPMQYEGILAETKATRAAGGLFDVSHMCQFSVRGRDAGAALASLVTNALAKVAVGNAQYNLLCRDDGGTLDDLIVYRRAEDWYFVCANASNHEKDRDWIASRLPRSVSFADESAETALVAVQGPRAEALLVALGGEAAPAIPYFGSATLSLAGVSAFVARTGYTGEDGFEVYLPADSALRFWEEAVRLGAPMGIVPAGLGARDTLRTEMGYPLYGHELGEDITPLEAGLRFAVKLDRPEPFVGQAALRAQAAAGVPRKLLGLTTSDRRIPRAACRVVDSGGSTVGTITSGTMSPHRESPIALALVSSHVEGPRLQVEARGGEPIVTSVTPLPFVPARTKRPPAKRATSVGP
jgi:aminomethyltransferase